jgi:hypothetical protein
MNRAIPTVESRRMSNNKTAITQWVSIYFKEGSEIIRGLPPRITLPA